MKESAIQSLSSLPPRPIIPAGWEAKAAMVDQCMFAGTRLKLWIAMLVAEGKADFEVLSDLVLACSERWRWQKALVYHLIAVGDFLSRPMSGVLHATLCDLEFEKLLCIARLPQNLVGPFMDKTKPADHTRDEVRAAVNRWLAAAGEPTDEGRPGAPGPGPAARQLAAAPVQVDFLDALFAATHEEVRTFHRRVQERALTVDDALPILNRAFAVVDVMIGRLDRRRPEAFAALAKDFRNEAARLEKMLADPGIVSPVRPLSPPPELASPEDAVRRRLPAVAKQE